MCIRDRYCRKQTENINAKFDELTENIGEMINEQTEKLNIKLDQQSETNGPNMWKDGMGTNHNNWE